MSTVTILNNDNFEAEVLKAEGKVLVDFWAPWCGPCKMQGPILDKVAQAEGLKGKVCKLNTDENNEISQKFNISSIPTLILFEDGKEVERMVGIQPEGVLTAKLS